MARNANLSYQRPILVKHTVTSAEETANLATFEINSGSLPTDDFLFVGQVKETTGVETPGFDWSYSTTSGTLTVADAGTANLASGQIITVMGTYFA